MKARQDRESQQDSESASAVFDGDLEHGDEFDQEHPQEGDDIHVSYEKPPPLPDLEEGIHDKEEDDLTAEDIEQFEKDYW